MIHGAVASHGLGSEVAEAALADWRTASLSPELEATLGFLEKLTLNPNDITPADARVVLDLGVTRDALEQAVMVCGLFNMVSRLADALDFELPQDEGIARAASGLWRSGYRGV